MAEKKIQARIRQKVDTKANWDKATNFVPLKGEYIYYSDLHKVKVGDGVTKVGALPFLADSDTHFTTGLYIGPANTKANGATTNGNTYLKAYDDNTKRAQFLIHGSGASSVSSDANGNITISSTDSHFTTGLYVGKVDEKSNSATTNGNTYLKLFDNDTKRSQHLINGGGATIVTSNASGTIEIATPIKTLDTTSGSGLGDGSSENIAGSGTIYLHKVAKTGSYNDLVNKPKIPTNVVTIDTEQFITGKKNFETDLNFGKYISPVRQVSDAPANLHFMNSAQTTGAFFDTVILAGAGDWLYLGHLKPDFSIRASFRGTGDENDTYSANLEYTHGTLNTLTDWDYQSGWMVRPTKVSTTTPAIIQIKFTRQLYTDVLRLIITGHNLNDTSSGSAYSGFLDDYTIEVCTNYTNDTWTTVVNRTNANDSIGAGLMYSLQTASYTPCYGIRLKITKCHVTGTGYAFIKISSMQLRDYRPGIKFPDCLGAISQGGGDVWGELYTKSNLVTHNVLPYKTNESYIGNANSQYWSVYSHDFYENGTRIADKYLDKGSASTNNNQVVYNPVEMKKALTAPSLTVSDIKNAAMVSTDANGKLTKSDLPDTFEQISVVEATVQYNDNIEITEVYLKCEGMESSYRWSKIVFSAPGSPAASNIKYYYNYMGQKTELTPTNASALNSTLQNSGEPIAVDISNDESNPTITYLPHDMVLNRGYCSTDEGRTKITYYSYNTLTGMPALHEIAPDTSTFLDKGTSSTVVNQVVYNPVEMKKALTVPSIQTTPIQYSPTDYGSAVSLGYTTINGITKAQIQLACPGLGYTYITQTDNEFAISATTKLSCNNNGGWTIAGSKIITEATLGSAVGSISSESIVSICI